MSDDVSRAAMTVVTNDTQPAADIRMDLELGKDIVVGCCWPLVPRSLSNDPIHGSKTFTIAVVVLPLIPYKRPRNHFKILNNQSQPITGSPRLLIVM